MQRNLLLLALATGALATGCGDAPSDSPLLDRVSAVVDYEWAQWIVELREVEFADFDGPSDIYSLIDDLPIDPWGDPSVNAAVCTRQFKVSAVAFQPSPVPPLPLNVNVGNRAVPPQMNAASMSAQFSSRATYLAHGAAMQPLQNAPSPPTYAWEGCRQATIDYLMPILTGPGVGSALSIDPAWQAMRTANFANIDCQIVLDTNNNNWLIDMTLTPKTDAQVSTIRQGQVETAAGSRTIEWPVLGNQQQEPQAFQALCEQTAPPGQFQVTCQPVRAFRWFTGRQAYEDPMNPGQPLFPPYTVTWCIGCPEPSDVADPDGAADAAWLAAFSAMPTQLPGEVDRLGTTVTGQFVNRADGQCAIHPTP